MKIINETELMYNQKASTTIQADVEFEALETSAGNAVIFSIGEDPASKTNKFYCTYELPGDTHGWVRADMSSALATGNFQGKTIVPKSFDVGQNTSARTIDIALVVTVDNQDWLYIACNVADSNLAGIPAAWQQFPFDDQGNMQYAGKPINDVFVTNINGSMFVFADINTQDAVNTLTRYAVDQSNSIMLDVLGYQQAWIAHGMAMDAQAGAISNAIGCGPDDAACGGIYTLCNIAGIPALQYAGLFNSNDPGGPAFPTNFQLPAGTDATYRAIATSASANAPYTDLFFTTNTTVNGAPTGALYFIPAAHQLVSGGVLPAFTQVYTHDLLLNIQSLHVNNWNNNIVLWGQCPYTDPDTNITSSQLFVMECLRGNETNPAAWSCPIPILFDVENSASYINNTYSTNTSINSQNGNAYGSCSVIFAHLTDGSIVQLFQDPVTTAWQQRSLLTEPLNTQTEIYNTTSYSTHIEITNDYNTVQPNLQVSVWASSPCSVYINDATHTDAYFTLDTEKPLQLTTDFSGNVTIMQPVDTIGGISYFVAVQDPTTKQFYSEAINPMTNTISRLNTHIPDGNSDYLANVSVTDEKGNVTPLVTSNYSSQTSATSNSIYTICQQNANLNPDGLATGQSWPNPAAVAAPVAAAKVAAVKTAVPGRLAKNIRFNAATDKIWGCTFGKNAQHYEGIESVKGMGVILNADNSLSIAVSNGITLGTENWFETKAGDIYKWMKKEGHKLENAVVSFTNGVIDCVLTIAGAVYHFVAKCANDIVNLVHTVLNAIETAFEDMVKWIGFIFEYADILRTHKVMKQFMTLFLNQAITDAGSLKGKIQSAVNGLENQINQMVGLPQIDDTPQSTSAQASKPQALNTPQSNWGTHKLKSNGANNNSSNYNPTNTGDDPTNGLLSAFSTFIDGEKDSINDVRTNIQSIIDNYQTTSVSDLFEKLLGAIADFAASQAGTILESVADIMATVSSFIMETLTAPIDIPVISWLYGEITDGEQFSILDLACLVAAIPATVAYKVLQGSAPFPDGDVTASLISAPDLPTLQSIWAQPLDNEGSGLLGHGDNQGQTSTRLDVAVMVSNIFGMVGSVGVSLCSSLKSGAFPSLKDNKGLNIANSVFYLMYVLPDATQSTQEFGKGLTWYNYINDSCTWASVLKTGVDGLSSGGWGWTEIWSNVSPWVDFGLNLLWQVPTFAAIFYELNKTNRANQVLTMTGATAFDISGMLSPVLWIAQQDKDPQTGPIGIGATCIVIDAFNLLWGISCILESWGPFIPPPSSN